MDLSQEERVMQHQIAIAEAMKVKPEILQILQKVGKWEIREWLYICALDGIDCEQIRQLAENSVTVADIREIRRKSLTDNQLVTGLHALEEEVRTVCQENKSVRAVIEEKLVQEREKQEKEYEQKLEAQEHLMSEQRKTILEMKEQLQEARKELVSLKDRTDGELKETESGRTEGTFNPESEKQGIRNFFIRKKRKDTIRRFIEKYLQDEQLSEEQKEYLLTCLEQGEQLSEMEKYAVPGLSVDQMKRIRKLKGRR